MLCKPTEFSQDREGFMRANRQSPFLHVLLIILLLSCFPFSNAIAGDSVSMKYLNNVYPEYPKVDYGAGAKRKLIQRGEYLAKMGDCIACHTYAAKKGKAFAGGLPIKTPFGTFYSPNITADKKTGIANWTDEDFITAMHDGINPKGQNYFPVFPYPYFNKISKQDLLAIKAYLFAIPKVNYTPPEDDVPFPFNWRFAQYGWKLLFFYPYKDDFEYKSKETPQWNRGRYIVDGLGHCAMCHSPLNMFGSAKRNQYLQGGFIEGFWAPDITGLGLLGASESDVVDVFAKAQLIHGAGPVKGPMAEVDHDSLSLLSQKDLKAIATYLKSIGPTNLHFGKSLEGRNAYDVGYKVFAERCSLCHINREAGAPILGDSPNWDMRLNEQGIDNLYKHAINGYNNMPPRGACVTCSPDEIKAAVDYILKESKPEQSEKERILRAQRHPEPTLADGRRIYYEVCSVCHAAGKLGAPITGDKAVWVPLIRKNVDVLYNNTIKGMGNMPTKCACTHCTNAEVMAAVKYMVQESKTSGDYSLW